jgi:putative ABC transport system permease protein
MKLGSTFKIAFRALRRNKLRSALTTLGIIIGVGTVIAMVSIGNGAKSKVEDQIASLGQNVIIIYSGSTSSGGISSGWGGAATLRVDDSDAIANEIPTAKNVSPEIRAYGVVVAGNQNWYTHATGVSDTYFDLRQWTFEDGVPFTEQDVRTSTKVAVIGQTVRKQLFGDDSPIGKVVRLRNIPFTIVGLLSSKGFSVIGTDQDDVFYIPYTTAMKRLTGDTSLRSLYVQANEASQMSTTQQQITDLLRQRHKIVGTKNDDFTVLNQQDILKMATESSRVMTLLLGSTACISLLVGGIGIMNIMLVSVTERTREIGIRMAVGAHGNDILLQFLIEAITLSSIGGIIGILLGFSISKVVSSFAGWPTLVSPSAVILSFLVSAVIGIFFGFYPARKAAKLDPIDALRYE